MDNIVEKEIDGILYKASYKGIAFANKLEEQLKDKRSTFAFSEQLFKEVLISPKVEIDDFADMESYSRVRDFLLEVATRSFEKSKSQSKLKQKVLSQWSLWRLVYCDMANFTHEEVFHKMTPQEIEEANIALDIVFAEIKKKKK